jgi:hypothetical protein
VRVLSTVEISSAAAVAFSQLRLTRTVVSQNPESSTTGMACSRVHHPRLIIPIRSAPGSNRSQSQ